MRISIFLCLFIILYPGWSLGDERCSSAVWGADDQLGAVNRITPAHVQQAAALVVKGERHPLGIVIDPAMPAYPSALYPAPGLFSQTSTSLPIPRSFLVGMPPTTMTFCRCGWARVRSLMVCGHMGEDGIFYNCHRGARFFRHHRVDPFGY